MKSTITSLLFLVFSLVQAQTFSNGGLSTGVTSNSGTAAPAGFTWSECQHNTGNTTESNTNAGFACAYTSTNSSNFLIADDFIVPAGSTWNVSSFDFFIYQTSYTGTVPPIDALRIQIWNGDPSLGTSTLVTGDLTTNVYDATNSSDALMFRIFNSSVPTPGSAPTTTRKIWKVRGNITASLTAGTYWVAFQAHAINDGTVFMPPVTIPGTRGLAGWNAKQRNVVANNWSDLVDAGNPATAPDVPQAAPFIVTYTEILGSESNEIKSAEIYPNPVVDEFYLDNNLNTTQIDVINMQGQLVKQFYPQEKYVISDLIPGIYFVQIRDASLKIKYTSKLIKN